ncbi:MAG: hypothetical protein ACOX7D_01610 [Alphaproteobacteria bacterium]
MYKFLRFCGIVFVCILSAPVFSAQNQRSVVQSIASRTPSSTNQSIETRSNRKSNSINSVSSRNSAQPARTAANVIVNRSGTTNNVRSAVRQNPSISASNISRSAIASSSTSMGDGYNTCREAYFACMDQFCAYKDETYRRCVCSSRLDGLREMANKVGQTQHQLENFADYNIDAISKTAKEVSASLTASAGESSVLADKSESAQKLAGISAILSNTKTKSLSTSGTLDIAGDIGAIWSTPDFIGSSDIANMEGEKLYSQVHGQCLDMVANVCPREATLNMVVSAYGMYIEQDCNIIQASLEGRKTTAAAAVRMTNRNMELARLENYDAHNSTEINDCIAQVRKDITSDTACGANFVHCLDVTGLYLDFNTGEPIYSPDFFKLENQTTLDGDFLNSNTNRLLIAKLEEYKASASRGLDTCRDVADDVWAEFKRQAVIEIYQAQQARVKQVRDECLSVVNQCYDEKIGQLKNFANLDSQMMIGQSVATAEALCQEKLNSCSNVFGGGSAGLESLLTFVKDVGSSKISENCKENLDKYIHEVCATTGDLSHSYPYSCRVRNPGSYECEMQRWVQEGSASCSATQSGSVYELLVKYARENCVRSDYPANTPLPSDVMEYVNSIFDTVLYDMRLVLKSECELYSGEWIDSGSKSNIELYTQLVTASDLWGSCIKPYCVFQGDAYLDDNGVKRCCPPNSIYDETCSTDNPCIPGTKCRLITCPANATINTSICDTPEKIISSDPPILGGCINNTNTSNSSYCKCSSNYYSIPTDYNDVVEGFNFEDFNFEDGQGVCWPKCPTNSHWVSKNDCGASGAVGVHQGCVSKYCQCDIGYKVGEIAGSFDQQEVGGMVQPGGAAVLPITLQKGNINITKKNKSNIPNNKKAGDKIARAGGTMPGGLTPYTTKICISYCPPNSTYSTSCTGPGPLHISCFANSEYAGCKCNYGYHASGDNCVPNNFDNGY